MQVKTPVILKLDDRDFREEGRYWGVGVFDASEAYRTAECDQESGEPSDDTFMDAICWLDPLDRCYGPTERAAFEEARKRCLEEGWIEVKDLIDYQEFIQSASTTTALSV